MRPTGAALTLPTLATTVAGSGQRWFAGAAAIVATLATCALLPFAAWPAPPMPGFVAVYQSALTVVYALTTYLFFAQYRRTRSPALLVLGAGSLYVTGVVLVQLLCFPNVLRPGLLMGTGPDTLTWLWTFWHLGPPVFALAYAVMEGAAPVPERSAGRTGVWAAVAATALVGVVILVTTRYVALLPKSVQGDDYSLIIWNGTGSGTQVLTLAALTVLCVRTRLRTVLQLWLAVSLLLLVADNFLTMAGGARGTVGWLSGRLGALAAGVVVLAVYLREVDFLYRSAESTAHERARQAAALRLARDNLDLALDAAGMGDWSCDLTDGTSRHDARHDAIFGHRQPVVDWGRDAFLAQVLPEDRPAARQAWETASRDGRLDLCCRIRRADDGAVRWIEMRGKAQRDADGRALALAGVLTDVTERREAEERLTQAQRMEAVGQLTGGVAHDFNNLLTIIVGNLDMIVRRPGDAARVERLARSGLQAARRGAEVTDTLLAFSRRQVLRPETVNANKLLRDFGGLLRRAVGETVEVHLDLDPALDPVRLDRGQFENAILNLAVNARDAMPSGGTLTVKSCNGYLAPEEVAGRPEMSAGEYVLVAVSDTGQGMDEATAARAFEPFFTTKDVGRGTGLGLAQVYGFVRSAGGLARIKTAPGKGTTVEIYLPRSGEAVGDTRPEVEMPLRRAVAGEVILVVEDEAGVLEMAVESLVELGYRTLTASNAAEALDRLRGPERIDILFSDVVMPGGMNGVQLAVEGRRIRPGLKVLLTSGYTGTALEDQAVPVDLPLLGKPYLREDLAAKLRLLAGGR